jgi:hypothetical protein
MKSSRSFAPRGIALSLGFLFFAGPLFAADEPATGAPSEVQIRARCSKLAAPPEWASSERVATGEGPYDGQECAPGLVYENNGRTLISLSEESLHLLPGNPLMSFEEFAKTGVLMMPPPTGLDVFCGDAGFDLIQIMGTVQLPPFDNAAWLVADRGQDECGETSVVVYASRGKSLVGLLFPFEGLAPGYACNKRFNKDAVTDESCAERTRCLRDYLAAPGKRRAVEKALRAATSRFRFAWK